MLSPFSFFFLVEFVAFVDLNITNFFSQVHGWFVDCIKLVYFWNNVVFNMYTESLHIESYLKIFN